MKFEESSLTRYLVDHLTPLTEADPAILSEYVVALLKKDKPIIELQKLCSDNLVEFLGVRTKPFVTELFQGLEDGSFLRSDEKLGAAERKPYQSTDKLDAAELEKPESDDNVSTSSGTHSDSQEVSDDDDVDRNHKHRRRGARSNHFEQADEQSVRKVNRKRYKPYENGKSHLEDDAQPSELQKEYNNTQGRKNPVKFEKRHSVLHAQTRAQAYRSNNGPRFELASSISRGRGRGRNIPWSQHDSRFNPLDTLDFASQIATQGPPLPGLFMGTSLPGGSNTQSSSWGSFGFIPGMGSRILDPLHPLGLPGAIGSAVTPPMNIGITRQRCRDFEEMGFCLRGDMCPMEHGVNRIVVEDVKSLSQFNLPVSLPNSRAPGLHDSVGRLPSGAAPTSSSKAMSGKNGKSGGMDGALTLNAIVSTSGGDADVYDPDQPLWSNDQPGCSNALLRLPSPDIDEEASWDADTSQSFRLSEGVVGGHPTRSLEGRNGSLSTTSSVWGRIGSGAKMQRANRADVDAGIPVYVKTEVNDDHQEPIASVHVSGQGNATQFGSIPANAQSVHKSYTHPGHSNGKVFPKASRTLYVNGIPQKDNKKDALLSHFRKFGEVVDVYIPQNSEKAFVQFSTREDAEAALKAPDAVMGNRFIKLWWANRDRIFDEGQSSHNKSQAPNRSVAVSTQQHPSVAGRERENHPSAAPTGNSGPSSVAALAGLPTSKKESRSTATIATEKNTDTLELLKEEIQRKQEILAKKRDEFRRQLDKLEKKAGSFKKDEVTIDRAVKRQKIDNTNVAKSLSFGQTRIHGQVERTVEHANAKETLVSHTLNANPIVMHQFLKDGRQITRPPVPMLNRFKLDNRPTSFRILPPLPAELSTEAALKEHFSSFGELYSVVFEDVEACPVTSDAELSHCSSACINFVTRHSAEKAFLAGKHWKGHTLKLAWLTPKSGNMPTSHEDSPSPKVFQNATTLGKVPAYDSYVSPKAIGNTGEASSVENNFDREVKCSTFDPPAVPKASIPASKSDSDVPSIEKTKSDDSMVEDVMHLSS